MITIFKDLNEAVKILGEAYVEKACKSLYEQYEDGELDGDSYISHFELFGEDLVWYMAGNKFEYYWQDNQDHYLLNMVSEQQEIEREALYE